MVLTRRDLVKSGLAVVVAGAFMPTIFSRAVAMAAADKSLSTAGSGPSKTLIVVQLAGGNDGLNTVIPYADSRYLQIRPHLGIPTDQVVQLDSHVGLHPSLKGLKPLWDSGKLAIVENVGYDHPSLSHFQAMDIWQTADPLNARHEGWLSTLVGGSVDGQGHPVNALSLGPSLAPALCCPTVPPPALTALADYKLQADPRYPTGRAAREDALHRLYASYAAPAPYAALLDTTAQTAETSSQQLQDTAAGHVPATGANYPKGGFGDGLKLLSALICKDLGLRVGYLVLGGFDTHAIQLKHHADLLKTLADGINAFQTDLAGHGKGDDVLLMTWSEFGRRAAENFSLGTDHGTAAPLFVVGNQIKGGLKGDAPDLGNLDNGNLRFATDFRSVYATVLDGWLQADSSAILGQKFSPVGIF
ncbi:MAG TPA: DUF1501 domain-containing protein [Chloroflexota bacterium]|nr:DUF1501 domain-containing protein [Chloroflexota bacterium]